MTPCGPLVDVVAVVVAVLVAVVAVVAVVAAVVDEAIGCSAGVIDVVGLVVVSHSYRVNCWVNSGPFSLC
mgnify:CR=1 FL=1